MSKSQLFACIISDGDEKALTSIADEFSANIELIEGGVFV